LSVAVDFDFDFDFERTSSKSKATDKSVRPTRIKVKGSGQEVPAPHNPWHTIGFVEQSELEVPFVLRVEVNKEET